MDIKNIELFKGLSTVEQAKLLGVMEKVEISEGELLFQQNDVGDSMFIIATGMMELYTVDEDGNEHLLTHLSGGEAFGEMALLTGEQRSASARALQNTHLYKMHNESFQTLVNENNEISMYLIKLLSKRLVDTNYRLKNAENENAIIIKKKLEKYTVGIQKLLLSMSVLKECPVTFIADYFGENISAENLDELINSCELYESTTDDCIYLADMAVSSVLQKLFSDQFTNEEKQLLVMSAVNYLKGTGNAFSAIITLAENSFWDEACMELDNLSNTGSENVVAKENLLNLFRMCPIKVLVQHEKALQFFLVNYIDIEPGYGFSLIEQVIENMDVFTNNEKAGIYRLAADYCKKLGHKQKSLEYLNMALVMANNIEKNSEGKKKLKNLAREYDLAEKKYGSSFNIAMAEKAQKLFFEKNRIFLLLAVIASILSIWYFANATPLAGLSRDAMIFIGISIATVAFWIVNVIPAYIVALLMAFIWIITGLVKPEVALSGFATPVWLYMICIFAFGTAIANSGLLYRLSLCILKAFPKSYLGQLLGLAISGLVFTPLIPSATAKVALSSTVAQSIAESMGFENRSKGSAGLGLTAMIFYGYMTSYFLTGSYVNLMGWGFVPNARTISWFQWFQYSFVYFICFAVLMFIAIVLMFRPEKTGKKISKETLNEQLKILGKIQGNELITAIVAALTIIALLTQSFHHLDSTWILLISVAVLVISGVLDTELMKTGVDWPFMLFIGISFGFVNVLTQFGIVQALTEFLKVNMHPFMASPYTFLPTVAISGFLLTLIIRDEPAVILLVVSMVSLTGAVGVDPWVLLLIILVSTDPFFFPYQSATYLTAYYGSQGKSFSNRQGQKLMLCYVAAVMLSALISIPYWQMIGLIK